MKKDIEKEKAQSQANTKQTSVKKASQEPIGDYIEFEEVHPKN